MPSHSAVLGVLTIGQAPRDDVLPQVMPHLPAGTRIVQAGALDGLSEEAIAALAPGPDEYVLTSRLRDGRAVTMAREKIVPLMQERIAALEAQGANPILILCTGEFPPFRSRALLVEPERLLPALVRGLGVRRLGVLVPLPEQIDAVAARWRAIGVEPAVAAGSPYGPATRVAEAARSLRGRPLDLVVMDCMGYTEAHRDLVRAQIDRPVMLASSAVARVIGALV